MFYDLLEPYINTSIRKVFKRSDYLYREGDSPKSLYIINSGLVGLFHTSESGKETFLRVFSTGSIFGHRSYFAKENYHASAIALTKTEITIISSEQCDEICHSQPALLKQMVSLMAKDLGEAELRLSGALDKSANRRIAESLIYLKLKYPQQIWTRKEIADFSGSTFETVTRVMTILSQRDLIIKEGRDFNIPETDKLLKYISLNF